MFLQPCHRIMAATAILLLGPSAAPSGFWLGQARAQVGAKAKTAAQPAPGAADARNDDRAAIRASLESFVKAFESRDAKALAAHWTAEGEYSRDDGVTIQGRPAIEKAFGDFFTKSPEVKAQIQPQSLRFVSRDTAIGEGSVSVRR